MRVLILGGTGMLGHQLYQSAANSLDVFVTVRTSPELIERYGVFQPQHIVPGVDALEFSTVEQAITNVRPDAVVNCIGIVKQHALAKDAVACIAVNSLFPHRLNDLCRERGSRLIHISTDCVFDGRKGNYSESDCSNATDLYGKSKALGEPTDAPALTIRTSIIGRELSNNTGLVEWFLSKRNEGVKGYTRARFSGLTTHELSKVIVHVLTDPPTLTGLYHVASEPIDKHDLLQKLNETYNAGVAIEPDDSVLIDRTLNGTAFGLSTGYRSPDWSTLVTEMAENDAHNDNRKEI